MNDQCPSTVKGEKKRASKAELAALKPARQTVAGQRAWRSAEELADTAEFRDFVEREFPAGASELLATSRRGFLQVMGASLALAGVATIPGCRRPEHHIMPYSREVPEDVIPGKPLYYATSMALPGGGAEGLLVETHEGRPTKIEGNPLHSVNQGKSSVWAQASVLNLYDPDRLKNPTYNNSARGRVDATWDDFRDWWTKHAASLGDGSRLAVIVDKRTSPSREFVKAQVLKKFPKASWVAYDAAENVSAIRGTALAFGGPARELYSFAKARVVVSFDRDFLNSAGGGPEPMGLVHARDFAAGRKLLQPKDASGHEASMSRLYVVESGCSMTGAQADHRWRLSPTRVGAFAYAVAARVAALTGDSALAAACGEAGAKDVDAKAVDAIAEDLAASKGASVVLAGPTQPAEVHALAVLVNRALGNHGQTVRYRPMGADEGAESGPALAGLCRRIAEGGIDTLVCVHVNPVYNAPGDLNFFELFKKVPNTIAMSTESSETALLATWGLDGAHALESWGDTEAADGTLAPIQPMIAPLYGSWSDLELLAFVAGNDKPDGYAIVRDAWKQGLAAWYPTKGLDFEKTWRRGLHDGVLKGTATAGDLALKGDGGLAAVGAFRPGTAPTEAGLDVVFEVGFVHDGRFANNAWLQELPATGTRVVWDNPAMLSPATAEKLGLAPEMYSESDPSKIYHQRFPEARMAEITVGGRKVTVPVWILPGMADDTVILTMGYGRTASGVVSDGVGFNVSPLRSSGDGRMARTGRIAKAEGRHQVISTQNHWTMESRTTIVRQFDLAAFHKHGAEVEEKVDKVYGTTAAALNMAERAGELSHTPPNIGLYANPFNAGKGDPDPNAVTDKDFRGRPAAPRYTRGQQWGMAIDLTTCTGCGACTIACQAENNIPVVGKREVAKGREMAWIRVDRYYTGDDINNPDQMLHQPVACVHCENAPCETVCPVNATVHGPEGLNYMTYNRCIGTRYCANNCPYKVRRFNFFDFGVTKFNGGYYGKDALEKVVPDREGITGSGVHNKINPNLVPPRLREKLDEITRMQKNPDVTVRSRGVMEKCSYCIQRINAAKVECKLSDLKDAGGDLVIPDGFFQTACQQACPSDAIVFGNILDEKSRVARERESGRSYMLLGYLNTRPRTLYLAGIRNPNPKLRAPVADPFHGAGHGGAEHEPQGAPHEAPAGAGEKHTFFDRRRAGEDRGYAMSLRVLGAGAGASA
jgi:molybdopterin-containing oxidoreductase family iron-sulfur binding subunit